MLKWKRSSRLIAAEEAYVEAEIEQLRLVCERNRMDKKEFQRLLGAAWLRSVNALEILTVLKSAEVAARLLDAAEQSESA